MICDVTLPAVIVAWVFGIFCALIWCALFTTWMRR